MTDEWVLPPDPFNSEDWTALIAAVKDDARRYADQTTIPTTHIG